jgi:hypothetical protein
VFHLKSCLIIAGLALLAAPCAFAQGDFVEPDPAKVPVQIGPLWMNPTLALTNLGVDTNVFNDPPDRSPKRDFTATITPKTDIWLRLGRTWMVGAVDEGIVWYDKYASERSLNDRYRLGWHVPLNRLTFDVGGNYLNTHDRPGFEIDARSHHTELGGRASAEVRWLSKTFFGVKASVLRTSFDNDNAAFDGVVLREALNRTDAIGAFKIRHELTPLTSISVEVAREQQRFEFSPLRNADSTQVAGRIAFDPAALIKGSASIGYRDFEPVDRSLPAYRGSTASADLSYTLLGVTQFVLQAARDVQYSYEIDQPYYVLTGVNGSIAQKVVGPFDVIGRAGVQQLDYRDRALVPVPLPARTDYVHTYGAGVGVHLGTDLRLGFNVDSSNRTSEIAARRYTGLRYGTSVTYGF